MARRVTFRNLVSTASRQRRYSLLETRVPSEYQRDRKIAAGHDKGATQGLAARALPGDFAIAVLESFDVLAYLNQTESFAVPPAERIRLLSVFLEGEKNAASLAEYPRSWLALQRLYNEACKLDPQNVQVLISNAVSAMHFAGTVEPESDVALYGIARCLLKQALSHHADSPYALYTMGVCEYQRPGGSSQNALHWFERACQSDPNNSWAQLYRAHCLHDLKEWNAAVVAYEAVDRSAFDDATSWRAQKLLEQLAWCRLQAGDRSGALHYFREVLRIYSGLADEEIAYPGELVLAACGPLCDELNSEVTVLAKRLYLQIEIERLEGASGA